MSGTKPNKLDALAVKLLEAKSNEAAWRKERVALEQQIVDVVGVKDEGTTTIDTDVHRVKTVGKINRSVTQADALALRDEVDEAAYKRLFGWTPKLLLKELHWLQENDRPNYEAALKRVTSKPAKASVAVEVLE